MRKKLEQHATEQADARVAHERTTERGGNDGSRDLGLREAHHVETEHCTEHAQHQHIDNHAIASPDRMLSSGITRAAGTSCAEISTPFDAIARNSASSSPVRKMYRSFCARPAR